MAMLASDWANLPHEKGVESTNENPIGKFDFVFLIELGHVKDNSSLEKIIIQQHGLTNKNISERQIKNILEKESEGKVLLILDGYNEYNKGTNAAIDSAIEDTIGHCFLIVTSRDGDYISNDVRNRLDGEIEITGLSSENIQKYGTNYFENEETGRKLQQKAVEVGIAELLRIPIILLMVCILYDQLKKLPRSQTEIISRIVALLLDRSALKHFKKKYMKIPGILQHLFKFGELSWKALKSRQSLLSKVILPS